MLFLLSYSLSVLLPFLLCFPLCTPTPTLKFISNLETQTATKQHADNINMYKFINAKRGSHITGISALKKYFNYFGYLPFEINKSTTDTFDARFESAIVLFQSNIGLPITGKLDTSTLSQIALPRCRLPNTMQGLHALRRYVYFPGKPRWARRMPMTLTYAFSTEYSITYLSELEVKEAFNRAFGRWAKVIPVSFVESDDYAFADIRIGFYSGDHGDGEPFDGVLGVLAHSFSPESGRLHLDAAERWAVDFETEKSPVAVDLESVATHEIGHLLGLAHSTVKESVMYPSLKAREKKVNLQVDDIKGVQALYGSNHNFIFGSLLESDTSVSQAIDSRIRSFKWAILIVVFIFCLCI